MQNNGLQELTDPENAEILATLTHESWRGLSVEAVAAQWFRLDPDLTYLLRLPNPLETLVRNALRSSGSIKGEHRKDLTQGVIGSPAQSFGLSVPIIQPNGQQPSPQERPQPVKRKGF